MNSKLKFPALILLLFAAFIFFSFHEPCYLKDFDLKGNVKKVIVNDYSAAKNADGTVRQGPWIDSVVYEFNENGKLISALTYRGHKNPDGYEYYTYDKDGHLGTHVKVFLNSALDSSFYIYKNGLLVERNSYSRIGKHVTGPEKTTFTYQQDQIIGEFDFSIVGDSSRKTINTYDAKGKLSKQVYMLPDIKNKMQITATDTYSYAENGLLSETVESGSEGDMIVGTWKYNSQGDKISFATKNSLFILTTFYEYVYDEKGNWIKCTSSVSQEQTESKDPVKTPRSVSTRTIIYY